METPTIRAALASAIGTPDYVTASLSRAEHGLDRATVDQPPASLFPEAAPDLFRTPFE